MIDCAGCRRSRGIFWREDKNRDARSRNERKIYFQILEPHTNEVGATAEQAGNRVTDRLMLTGQLGWQGGLEGKVSILHPCASEW